MTCDPGTCGGSPTTPCILFLHSDGCFNCEPCLDLGGPPSTCPITLNALENLFHNIGPNLTRLGHEDYRCFYVANGSMTDTIRNTIIYMDGTGRGTPGLRGGTYHAIGVFLQDAIQQVTVTGPGPFNQGEYFTLNIPAPITSCLQPPAWIPEFQVQYDVNITKWQGNFQTAIRTVEGMPEVVVTAEGVTTPVPNVIFTVYFGGHSTRNVGDKGSADHQKWDQAAKHAIPLMIPTFVNLTNGTVITTIVANGSPVNTIAEVIPNEITPPAGINFDYFFRGNPIRIGDLRPQEFVPIWIRRTLPFPTPRSGALARAQHTAFLVEYFMIRVDGTYP